MSVRLVLLFIFSLNLSCTAVFNSNNLASMGLALSKYNDFAYFVDMDEPFSISSQGKLSAISLDFEFSCFYDQAIDQSVNNTNSCNDLDNFFFNSTTGDFNWSPNSNQGGDYEFKVVMTKTGQDISQE